MSRLRVIVALSTPKGRITIPTFWSVANSGLKAIVKLAHPVKVP